MRSALLGLLLVWACVCSGGTKLNFYIAVAS